MKTDKIIDVEYKEIDDPISAKNLNRISIKIAIILFIIFSILWLIGVHI